MFFLNTSRVKTGMEISQDLICAASVHQTRDRLLLNKLYSVKIPAGVIKPSFRSRNILDPDIYVDSLREIKKKLRRTNVSIAIPDACTKILIKSFRELPEDEQDINDLIGWDLSNILKVDIDDLRFSWEYMGRNSDGHHIFLVVGSLLETLGQYEEGFKKSGFSVLQMKPAGLGQFNFYCPQLPDGSSIAYLALSDSFVSLFVFHQGVPVFYKSIRKGLLSVGRESAIDDLDLLVQYYSSEFPDLKVDTIYVASYLKSMDELRLILQDAFPGDIRVMDEQELVQIKEGSKDGADMDSLPFFSAALGIARGG